MLVTVPQFLPAQAAVVAVHPHTFATDGVPPPHDDEPLHAPQLTVRVVPQLSVSVAVSQFLPLALQRS